LLRGGKEGGGKKKRRGKVERVVSWGQINGGRARGKGFLNGAGQIRSEKPCGKNYSHSQSGLLHIIEKSFNQGGKGDSRKTKRKRIDPRKSKKNLGQLEGCEIENEECLPLEDRGSWGGGGEVLKGRGGGESNGGNVKHMPSKWGGRDPDGSYQEKTGN